MHPFRGAVRGDVEEHADFHESAEHPDRHEQRLQMGEKFGQIDVPREDQERERISARQIAEQQQRHQVGQQQRQADPAERDPEVLLRVLPIGDIREEKPRDGQLPEPDLQHQRAFHGRQDAVSQKRHHVRDVQIGDDEHHDEQEEQEKGGKKKIGEPSHDLQPAPHREGAHQHQAAEHDGERGFGQESADDELAVFPQNDPADIEIVQPVHDSDHPSGQPADGVPERLEDAALGKQPVKAEHGQHGDDAGEGPHRRQPQIPLRIFEGYARRGENGRGRDGEIDQLSHLKGGNLPLFDHGAYSLRFALSCSITTPAGRNIASASFVGPGSCGL